jgi:hypothetical protein
MSVLQRLRESVTRVRTTVQEVQSAGYIAGGTSDRAGHILRIFLDSTIPASVPAPSPPLPSPPSSPSLSPLWRALYSEPENFWGVTDTRTRVLEHF